MVQPDQETLKKESFDPKKFYREHPEAHIGTLSGRSLRKIKRANTVHLLGLCPGCGATLRYNKHLGGWHCWTCQKTYKRSEFKYVKYN